MSTRWTKALIGGGVAIVVAGGTGLVLLVGGKPRRGPPASPGPMRAQAFERDPGWEGRNNRRLGPCTRTRQDFGALADGASVGGAITRSARVAWYGRPVALGFDRAFVAQGRLVVRGTAPEPFPSGSAMIGFFNASNRDWRPPNLLAFQVNADTVPGGDYSLSLAYGASNWEQAHVALGGEDSPAGLRFGQPYRWRLAYDPDGADGRGQAVLSVPGAGPPAALPLAPGARQAGAALDRFGVANQVTARGEELRFELGDLELDGVVQRPGGEARGWQGVGNDVVFQDCFVGQPNSFGWTGAGDRRLGGLVGRTDEDKPEMRAFYADTVGQLTLDDRLHAEGTVQLDRANTDSAALLGWFKGDTTGEGDAKSAPPDFLGISITGPSRIGQYFGPLVADGQGEVASEDDAGVVFNPSPRTVSWSLDYDPAAGDGGEIVVRLGSQRRRLEVPRKLRRTGASFDRFGLRNLERGGSFQVVHFDDLRYSISPRSGQERAPRRSVRRRGRR